MSTRIGLFAGLMVAVFASVLMAQGEEPAKRPAKPEPAKSPLVATLIANKDTYTIPEGQRGKEFAAKVKSPSKGETPEPPAVDMVLQLKNPTDKSITIMVDSDAGSLDLKLEGPGAVIGDGRRIFTREFRLGKPVEIAPGKTHEIPIKALRFGFRGVAQHAYWTEPGTYKIVASLRWPDPFDDSGKGTGIWQATSEPIEVTVKE